MKKMGKLREGGTEGNSELALGIHNSRARGRAHNTLGKDGFPRLLVKVDDLATSHGICQTRCDARRFDGIVERDAHAKVAVQAGLHKFARLRHKGLLEALVVRRRRLCPDAMLVQDLGPVENGCGIDKDSTFRTDDFARAFVAMDRRSAQVESEAATIGELHHTRGIVGIAVLAQLWVQGVVADRKAALHACRTPVRHAIGIRKAQHPPSNVNVVNAAVDKDTTGLERVRHEPACAVVLIHCDALDEEGFAELARLESLECGAVRGIESSTEGYDDADIWSSLASGKHLFIARRIDTDGLLEEDMETALDSIAGQGSVKSRLGRNDDGVEGTRGGLPTDWAWVASVELVRCSEHGHVVCRQVLTHPVGRSRGWINDGNYIAARR